MERNGKYKLHYATEARRDLEKIGTYIASTLKSPLAATRLVNLILDETEKLRTFAYMGIPLWKAGAGGRDYRSLIVENYRVLYRIEADTVYVVRILYGRRDYLRTLFEQEQAKPEDVEE